ncbi:hypothetical protein Acr_05g0003040 [Actinidia rufa]|uniref:Uncharacterized protein n=1 Tax=Actinidia rufa TaxID=165716 RepID=A0A7J0EJL5_9ERIC|nr:hypothetical protein Acr_05g0003040 [Actinidia rufa]
MVSKPSKPSPPPTALTAAQTPAASVQPSPFLPPLRVQIPTSASAATINQPPSTSISGQPRSHQSTKAQPRSCTQPSPFLPQPSSAAQPPQLLHPAQLSLAAPAAAPPSSSDSNLCECSHHQPPSQANLAAISPQRRNPDPAPSPAQSPSPQLLHPAQLSLAAPAAAAPQQLPSPCSPAQPSLLH